MREMHSFPVVQFTHSGPNEIGTQRKPVRMRYLMNIYYLSLLLFLFFLLFPQIGMIRSRGQSIEAGKT